MIQVLALTIFYLAFCWYFLSRLNSFKY